MGRLIQSESSFKKCKHRFDNVVGLCGINKKVWAKECPYDPMTDRGNIFSSAWIMQHYLALSKGDYYEAIAHYKSYTPEGKKLARQVLKGI